jgi:hypothetical protein
MRLKIGLLFNHLCPNIDSDLVAQWKTEDLPQNSDSCIFNRYSSVSKVTGFELDNLRSTPIRYGKHYLCCHVQTIYGSCAVDTQYSFPRTKANFSMKLTTSI